MSEEKVINVVQSSLPPLDEYVEEISSIWETHWLTHTGPKHQELAKQLKEYLGVENIALFANGHLSLEMAIEALGIKGEVITTPFTFASTTQAIVRCGLTPVFCDIEPDTYTLDPEKIEALITERTSAILPVHVYGNVCNWREIERIAKKHDLKVIYDAAHAFGETYQGKGVGSFGDLSTFSFHATKVFHTIEGGCVCSKTREQYEKLYNLKNFGIRNEELIVSVGANAKMNEFQAAMGLCNLKYLQQNIEARKRVVERYCENFSGEMKLRLNQYQKGVEPNYAYMPVLFETAELRDKVYTGLRQKNIFSRKYFYPITADAACFRNKYKKNDLEQARDYSNRILVLPLYASLRIEQVDMISKAVLEIQKEG